MSRTAARHAALLAVLAALALPASAFGDSGSITDVQRVDASTARATFSVTSTHCGANGYCGFFAYARLVPAAQPCAVGSGRAIWVSDDVATESGSMSGSDTFPLTDDAPVRLCLFLYQAQDREYPVAETVFDPAANAARPSTVPPASVAIVNASRRPAAARRRARTLSTRSARAAAAAALRRKYGRAYRSGKARRMSCRRRSRTRMRCSVSWRHGRLRYRGTVRLTSTATAKVASRISVRRTRLR